MKTAALCAFGLFVVLLVIAADISTEAERRRIRNTRHIINELNDKDSNEHHTDIHN